MGICWECHGPCLIYRGTVHGWRCSACIDKYLQAAAARADAKVQRHRETLSRNTFHSPTPSSLGSK